MSIRNTPDRHKLITETAKALQQRGASDTVAEVAAELLAEMSGSDRRETTSRTAILLQHLIKWGYQPQQRSASWTTTINTQRRDLTLLFQESPSLRRHQELMLATCWTTARRYAILEMKANPYTAVPAACPWTLKQAMNPRWLPQ
jgi:hypothetical protein